MILTEQVDGSVCGWVVCAHTWRVLVPHTVTWATGCSYLTTLLVT